MTIAIPVGGLSACSAGGHVNIQASINGSPLRTFIVARSDFALDDLGAEQLVLARLKSAAKEAGATTGAQIKAALEGKTFQV
jgi:hypothetical protein